jgi:hypothetical protein
LRRFNHPLAQIVEQPQEFEFFIDLRCIVFSPVNKFILLQKTDLYQRRPKSQIKQNQPDELFSPNNKPTKVKLGGQHKTNSETAAGRS